MLRLDIPSSPLLPTSSSDTVFSPAVIRSVPLSRSAQCLSSISGNRAVIPASYSDDPPSGSSSTSSSDDSLFTPLYCVRSVPEITVTLPLSDCVDQKPPRVPSKQVIALLDLLDKIDRDIVLEVQRVKENIKDAHAYVDGWREERRAREIECMRKKARERKETKGLDSDFWLGV